MSDTAAQDMQDMAADELERATSLRWRDLSAHVPWGDVYDGFSPSGRAVQVERTYVWASEPGGDILCEVNVYANPVRYDDGARRSAQIAKPR